MKLSKIIGSNPTTNMLFFLFLVLVVLKMIKVLGWSWWIVTAPLWGPLGLLLVFLISYYVHILCGGFLGTSPNKDDK